MATLFYLIVLSINMPLQLDTVGDGLFFFAVGVCVAMWDCLAIARLVD